MERGEHEGQIWSITKDFYSKDGEKCISDCSEWSVLREIGWI